METGGLPFTVNLMFFMCTFMDMSTPQSGMTVTTTNKASKLGKLSKLSLESPFWLLIAIDFYGDHGYVVVRSYHNKP